MNVHEFIDPALFDRIEIMRMVHGSRDLESIFPKQDHLEEIERNREIK